MAVGKPLMRLTGKASCLLCGQARLLNMSWATLCLLLPGVFGFGLYILKCGWIINTKCLLSPVSTPVLEWVKNCLYRKLPQWRRLLFGPLRLISRNLFFWRYWNFRSIIFHWRFFKPLVVSIVTKKRKFSNNNRTRESAEQVIYQEAHCYRNQVD